MFCLQCLVHMQTRKRMRQKYGLEEEPCNDFHVTAWCVHVVAAFWPVQPCHCATSLHCHCVDSLSWHSCPAKLVSPTMQLDGVLALCNLMGCGS